MQTFATQLISHMLAILYIIYIKRDKKALMSNILRKNSSIADKVNRLSAIDYEDKNAALCDYVVSFNTYDEALKQLRNILK